MSSVANDYDIQNTPINQLTVITTYQGKHFKTQVVLWIILHSKDFPAVLLASFHCRALLVHSESRVKHANQRGPCQEHQLRANCNMIRCTQHKSLQGSITMSPMLMGGLKKKWGSSSECATVWRRGRFSLLNIKTHVTDVIAQCYYLLSILICI